MRATSDPLSHPGGGAAGAVGPVPGSRPRAAAGQGRFVPGAAAGGIGAQRQRGAELTAAPTAPGAQPAAGGDWLAGEAAAAYWTIGKFGKARAAAGGPASPDSLS